MKYVFRLLFTLCFGCCLATGVSALDAKSGYLILGPGSYSCEKIIGDLAKDAKDKNPATTIILSNWLAGNLTSYNRDSAGTYSILGNTKFDEAFAWTIQYCEENSDSIYAGAVDALVQKLKPHRQTAMPIKKAPKKAKEDKAKEDKDDDDDDDDDDDMRD